MKAKPFLFISICIAVLGIGTIAFSQNSKLQDLLGLEEMKKSHEDRAKTLEDGARKAQKEIEDLQAKLVLAAANVTKAEISASKKQSGLKNVIAREKKVSADFEAQKQALEKVVIALIGIETNRPPALAVKPNNPTEAARVSILIRLVAPMIQERAEKMGEEIKKLNAVRNELLMRDKEYKLALNNLRDARTKSSILIAERQRKIEALRAEAAKEQEIIADIKNKATNLRDLLAKLGMALPANNDEINPNQNFENSKGNLPSPVFGTIVQRFGVSLQEGGTSSGINILTQPQSQVISPFDGSVEFSSDFRSFGRVVIINVGDNYRIVLAGLNATYVEIGQQILAGEPIGEMAASSIPAPILYFEIRKDQTPVNPINFLQKDSLQAKK